MHHLLSFLPFLLSLFASVQAWDCLPLFQQELQNEGLSQLALLLTAINQTSEGQDLFAQISKGNYTFFAPTNEALQNSSVSQNTSLITEYLSYHFVHGNFQNLSASSNGSSSSLISGIFPNTTVGRTLLNSTDLVMLPGNNSQALAWTRSDENSSITILNQVSDVEASQNITVLNTTLWSNLLINRINGVLIPPGNITTALNATNATITASLLDSIQVPSPNGTNITGTEFLQNATGITFFVPNNLAFLAVVNQTISSLQNNVSALAAVVENHYINGTVLYGPVIQAIAQNSSTSSNTTGSISNNLDGTGSNTTATNYTTAAGEPLQFITNSSGTFVESNNMSAKIVRPDVLISNGVIHIIDTVLLNNESDPGAASSAYESATSVAASITTETGPIGVFTTSEATPTSSSSSSSSESSTTESSTSTESSSSTESPSSTETSSASETGTVTVTATSS